MIKRVKNLFLVLSLVLLFNFSSALLIDSYGSSLNYAQTAYAPPMDIFSQTPSAVIFNVAPEIFSGVDANENVAFDVSVNQEGAVIWKQGYYFNSTSRSWVAFDFEGDVVKNSQGQKTNWISSSATKKLILSSNGLSSGANPVIAYVCKKYNDVWKCGCSSVSDSGSCKRWSLQLINISGSLPLSNNGNNLINLPGQNNNNNGSYYGSLSCSKLNTQIYTFSPPSYCNSNLPSQSLDSTCSSRFGQGYVFDSCQGQLSMICKKLETSEVSCSQNPSCPAGYSVVTNTSCSNPSQSNSATPLSCSKENYDSATSCSQAGCTPVLSSCSDIDDGNYYFSPQDIFSKNDACKTQEGCNSVYVGGSEFRDCTYIDNDYDCGNIIGCTSQSAGDSWGGCMGTYLAYQSCGGEYYKDCVEASSSNNILSSDDLSNIIEVTSCMNLDQEGKTYKLMNDLVVDSNSDCIVISGSNIVLEGNGKSIVHSIDFYVGPGSFNGKAISVGGFNNTIKDISSISGFNIGVEFIASPPMSYEVYTNNSLYNTNLDHNNINLYLGSSYSLVDSVTAIESYQRSVGIMGDFNNLSNMVMSVSYSPEAAVMIFGNNNNLVAYTWAQGSGPMSENYARIDDFGNGNSY